MTKEEALVEAMIKAIVSPSETESNQATELALEISRNMTLEEVQKCQEQAKEVIKMKKELDGVINEIIDKHLNKQQTH
jgi:hypothetical protein